MAEKKFPNRSSNPNTEPSPRPPHEQPSIDSRKGHGLSGDEVLESKG